MDRIAEHFEVGRTTIIAKLGEIRRDPDLVEIGSIRSRIKLRKHKFMGG